jgi:predicted nucleotidyltransferase component of viral defense system
LGGSLLSLSKETLNKIAGKAGFQPDTLEKVSYLLELLNNIAEDEFLQSRLVLKGGTALNLFHFDLPRLSVDIDLNYIGSTDRATMEKDRYQIEKLLPAICSSLGLKAEKSTEDHACRIYKASYQSVVIGRGAIKIDINYLHRVAYWPPEVLQSYKLDSLQAKNVPVISLFELAAGKLVALLARTASRDLFDVNQLAKKISSSDANLRLAYVLYAAKQPKDWRKVSSKDISITNEEVTEQLFPLLSKAEVSGLGTASQCKETLLTKCAEYLAALFPLTEAEAEFVELLRNKGAIEPSLLTKDEHLTDKIKSDPALKWRAQQAGK